MIEIKKPTSKTADCNSCGSSNDVKEILIGPKDTIKSSTKLCNYCRRVLLTKMVEDFRS